MASGEVRDLGKDFWYVLNTLKFILKAIKLLEYDLQNIISN